MMAVPVSTLVRTALIATLFFTAAAAADPAPTIRYTADPAKSALEFQFVQAGAQSKGRFTKFPVTLEFSPDNLPASKLDVTVDTNSLDSGDKERDDTLRSPDMFDVAKYPQARFTSSQITKSASGYDAVGK